MKGKGKLSCEFSSFAEIRVAAENLDTQLTIDELLLYLDGIDDDLLWPKGFGRGHSYRGVYNQVAFSKAWSLTTAQIKENVRAMINVTVTGYKGGYFPINGNTLVNWADESEYNGYNDNITPSVLYNAWTNAERI